MDRFKAGLLGTLGTAFDLATPGSGSNRLTDYASSKFRPAPIITPRSTPSYLAPLDPNIRFGSGSSGYDPAAIAKELAALRAESQRIAAQPRPVTPNFDAINAQARKAATKAVNPFYQKQLATLLKNQAAKKKYQTTVYNRATGDVEEALKTSLEAGELARSRTLEDVGTKLGDVAREEDIFQTDEGQGFDQAREALIEQQVASGSLGSGMGAQQAAQQVTDRNVGSERQTQEFNTTRKAVETFKTRTFEDLLTGDVQVQKQTKRKKEDLKLDFNRFLEELSADTKAGKVSLESERLSRLIDEEERQRQLGFRQFLKTITNPGQLAATAQTYGSLI